MGSPLAELLCSVKLIIWDEAPIQNKYDVLAVDRTLRDIRKESDLLFGGIPVVFGGDFAQILPVLKRGKRYFINSSLNGKTSLSTVVLGECHFTDTTLFYRHIFPEDQLNNPYRLDSFLMERAILAPHNNTVDEINEAILDILPGIASSHYSIDTADVNDDTSIHEVSDEEMESETGTFPRAHLRLKIGAPIMLLRNLHNQVGLCNGACGAVQGVSRYCLKFKIVGVQFDESIHAIPRVKLSSEEGELHYILTRKQFPVRLCFCMSIKKSQGQSLKTVGLDLRNDCFSHEHIYVALSRTTDVRKLSIL